MTPLFPMTRFRRASNLDACRDLSYSLLTYSPTAQRWRPAVNQSPASRSVRRCASLVAAVVLAAVAVGAGSTASSAQAGPPNHYASVSAGDFHSCGLRADRTVVCWGARGNGQIHAPGGTFK